MILKNCKKIIANVAFISDKGGGGEFLKTIHHMRKDNHKKILISENTGTAKLAQGEAVIVKSKDTFEKLMKEDLKNGRKSNVPFFQ